MTLEKTQDTTETISPKEPNINVHRDNQDAIDMDIEVHTTSMTKILIAKKFLLERRVLTKVIENLGLDYDILEAMDSLQDKLHSGKYDIVFADTNLVEDNSISNTNNNIVIITENKSKEEIEDLIRIQRG